MRREDRHRLILETAEQLFSQRDFHRVSIDDIGAAAGITGPAIYRYFRSKAELLGAVVRQLCDRMLVEEERLLRAATSEDRVRLLVEHLVSESIANRGVVRIWLFADANLLPEDREVLTRTQRQLRSNWQRAVSGYRPDLHRDVVAVMVEAVLGLSRSVAFVPEPVDEAVLFEVLSGMCRTSLDAPISQEGRTPSTT